jgi:hypothetical protein
MIPLKLTEYRNDGNYYPVVVIFGAGAVIREAELKSPGPHIINVTKPVALGSFITLAFNQQPITVAEKPSEILALLVPSSEPDRSTR